MHIFNTLDLIETFCIVNEVDDNFDVVRLTDLIETFCIVNMRTKFL